MAKIYGLNGVLSGRQGNTVFAVRNGENIARKYQPIVSNPKSETQVANRARLKLISQLSAVMAPFIAMPREGSKSPRNLFVKKNFGSTTYSDSQADVNLVDVKLTNSVLSLPPVVTGERTAENIPVFLGVTGGAALDIDRVVYVAFVREADGSLRYAGSVISNEPSANNSWPAALPLFRSAGVVYGYGVRFNSEDQRVAFGNMEIETAADVANLVVTRGTNAIAASLTETRAVLVPVAQ